MRPNIGHPSSQPHAVFCNGVGIGRGADRADASPVMAIFIGSIAIAARRFFGKVEET